jgi:hypothetical protein
MALHRLILNLTKGKTTMNALKRSLRELLILETMATYKATIANWDRETLEAWAQLQFAETLTHLSDEQIEEELNALNEPECFDCGAAAKHKRAGAHYCAACYVVVDMRDFERERYLDKAAGGNDE